jgi:GGDEF domain-containing protein
VIILEIDASVTAGLRSAKSDGVVRAMASYLRSELRLVDDIGRLRNGAFLVLLPQTGRGEAESVGARLASGLRDSIGLADGAVRTQVFGALEDISEIETLSVEFTAG